MSKGLDLIQRQQIEIIDATGNVCINLTFEEFTELEKELKALEILKKEPYISINWYLKGTYEEYIDIIERVKMTKNEWDLVKEVML